MKSRFFLSLSFPVRTDGSETERESRKIKVVVVSAYLNDFLP